MVAVIEDPVANNNGVYLFVGNSNAPSGTGPYDYWHQIQYWKKLAFAVDVDNETTNWIDNTDPSEVHVKKVSGGTFGTQVDASEDLTSPDDYLDNTNI